MKKYFLFLLLVVCFLPSCQENMPEIACLSCDDEMIILPPENKRVLIEEFTGVRCINCPSGSAEIENLLDVFGQQLIAVSIHAEFFAEPYDENQYDFRTPEGDFLINFLGLPEAYPSAVIDRKQFTGESDLQLVGQGSWAGRIGTEVEEIAKVALIVETDYNDANRELKVTVSGQAQEIIDEQVQVTIMITESGIVDAQLTPESSPGLDEDYVHKHALRKVITSFGGDDLAPSMAAGDMFEEVYTYTLPDAWDPNECEVIAFVHLSENSKDVLQATQAHVVN